MEDKSEEKTTLLEELLHMWLPKTREEDEIEITLNPRLDDIARRDYIRMPFRIRYGITGNLEMSFRLTNFLDNPFRGDTGTGLSDIFLGTKYQWKRILKPYVDSATAFSVLIPNDDRLGMTDGRTHYQPQLIFSKILPNRQTVQLSLAIHMDILSSHPNFNDIPEGDPAYNALGLFLGAAYLKPSYNYSIEIFWITTEIDGGHENPVYISPGLFWNIPKRRYPKLPGLLRIDLGMRFGVYDTAEDFAFIARLNWNLPIKKYLRDRRARGKDSGNTENDGQPVPF
ncbi:MAG: hypothetical protein ACMUIL_14140 [bacterium]